MASSSSDAVRCGRRPKRHSSSCRGLNCLAWTCQLRNTVNTDLSEASVRLVACWLVAAPGWRRLRLTSQTETRARAHDSFDIGKSSCGPPLARQCMVVESQLRSGGSPKTQGNPRRSSTTTSRSRPSALSSCLGHRWLQLSRQRGLSDGLPPPTSPQPSAPHRVLSSHAPRLDSYHLGHHVTLRWPARADQRSAHSLPRRPVRQPSSPRRLH